MNEVTIFLIGIAISLLLSFLVVFYLNNNLKNILIDICGTEERAKFWNSISTLCLILVPFMFSMIYKPERGGEIVFDISRQLGWALFGMIGTIGFLSLAIAIFIPKQDKKKSKS